MSEAPASSDTPIAVDTFSKVRREIGEYAAVLSPATEAPYRPHLEKNSNVLPGSTVEGVV